MIGSRIAAFLVLTSFLAVSPALAASKSFTVTTSCVIEPVMELSFSGPSAGKKDHKGSHPLLTGSPRERAELNLDADNGVRGNSNLQGKHRPHQKTVTIAGKRHTIYSLTAL